MKPPAIYIAVCYVFVLALSACKDINNEENVPVVARCAGETLNKNELLQDVPGELQGVHREKYIDRYIQTWCLSHYFAGKAKTELDNLEDIEKKVAEYRRTLYRHHYIEHFVEKSMQNYELKEDDVLKYYEKYKDSFVAEEAWWKYVLIETPPRIKGFYSIKAAIDKEHISLADSLLKASGDEYSLDRSSWCKVQGSNFDFGGREILEKDMKQGLNKTQVIWANESVFLWKTLAYVEQGDTLPFELVKEHIVEIIKHRTRTKLIEKMEREALEKCEIMDVKW